MKDNKIIKIVIPILIFLVIVGMWFLKKKDTQELETVEKNTIIDVSDLPENLKDADFSLKITEAVDFEKLSEYEIPAIIDYGADSCVPCKEMAPVLEKLNKEMVGKAFIKFADVWQYGETANNVPVQVIPTQVIVNADGTPFVPSDELAEQIDFTMYSHQDTGEHVFTVHQGGLTEEQMRLILAEMGVE